MTGTPKALDNLYRNSKILIQRGELNFSPLDDKKETQVKDTKTAKPADTKEVKASDSKQTAVKDVKKPKTKEKKEK